MSIGAGASTASGAFGAQKPRKGMFRTVGQLYKVGKRCLVGILLAFSVFLQSQEVCKYTSVFSTSTVIVSSSLKVHSDGLNQLKLFLSYMSVFTNLWTK